MNDTQLSHELDLAVRQAIDARARIEEIAPHSAAYQSAVIACLQTTVLYLSIMSVVQARRREWLVAEVEDLKEALAARPHAVQRPHAIH